jgi:hypothetical protein
MGERIFVVITVIVHGVRLTLFMKDNKLELAEVEFRNLNTGSRRHGLGVRLPILGQGFAVYR